MPLTPEELEALATSPAEASGDTGSRKARSAEDVIKLDQYAKAVAAATGTNENGGPKSRFRGIISRSKPPGSI